MNRVLLVAMALALVACGGGSSGGGNSGGGGGGASSVPSGFTKCPQSGDVTKISDKDTQGEWQYQSSKNGATGGDIEVYAASSGDCEGMPDIRAGAKKIIASAVITYKDAATARSAFSGGVFGVSHGAVTGASGASSGSATGFGADSVYAYSSGESAALWLNGTKVTAVIGENLSESDFKNYADALK